MRQNKGELRRALADHGLRTGGRPTLPPAPRAPLATARATWLDPADMPAGHVVQVRDLKGGIWDGALEIAPDGQRTTFIWLSSGEVCKRAIMGWMPLAGGVAPLPAHAPLSITDVVDQVFSGLRVLRSDRGRVGPRGHAAAWPKHITEFSDSLGHMEGTVYVPLEQRQGDDGSVRIPGPAEVYTPTPAEIAAAEDGPALKWFAALKGRCRVVSSRTYLFGQETTVESTRLVGNSGQGAVPFSVGEFSAEQEVLWLRSLAFMPPAGRGIGVRPPEWEWIARRMRIKAQPARRLFDDATRKLWFLANGGTL
jgi:hypothetical protein